MCVRTLRGELLEAVVAQGGTTLGEGALLQRPVGKPEHDVETLLLGDRVPEEDRRSLVLPEVVGGDCEQ